MTVFLALMQTLFSNTGEGEVKVFSAKHRDRRNRAGLIESATPCHDAQVVGSYRGSNPLHQTVLTSKSEDYTITPQHLHFDSKCSKCGIRLSNFSLNCK